MTALAPDELEAAALDLWRAGRDAAPVPPLTERWRAMTVADAYEVQRRNVARRVVGGAAVVGHKVGLTSAAMQQQLGVDEPDFGHVLDDMIVTGTVPAAAHIAPRVEPEIAFRIGAELRGPGCRAEDVRAATTAVVPALEVIDSRIADWRIRLADTIADNASSAAVVLGDSPVPLDDLDLRAVPVRLVHNGREFDAGTGAAVLGDPLRAVAWLVDKLAEFGEAVAAGHLVMPGSCTRAAPLAPGDRVRADFGPLGSVAVTCA